MVFFFLASELAGLQSLYASIKIFWYVIFWPWNQLVAKGREPCVEKGNRNFCRLFFEQALQNC